MLILRYSGAFVMMILCLAPAALAGPSANQWQKISYQEATAGKMRPLDLELSLPPEFIVRYSNRDNIGTLWGRKADIDRILKSNPLSMAGITHGVFRIFWSMQMGYFRETDKFSGEDEAEKMLQEVGITHIQQKRITLGGYPAWIQTGDSNGRPLFACYIATLNGTNVVTILYHTPQTPAGDEKAIWDSVIASIHRPPHLASAPDGEDAKTTIARLLAMLAPHGQVATTIVCQHLLGPEAAGKRPTIHQTATIEENPEGFLSLTFERTSSRELVEGHNTTLFGPPWSDPARRGRISVADGRILMELYQNGQRLPTPDIAVADFKKKNRPAYTFLSGGELLMIDTFQHFMTDVIALFDFRMHHTPDTIVLDGRPDKTRVQDLLDAIGMPRKVRGVVIVEEIMKRWSRATITLDPQSLQIIAFKVEGTNQKQPYSIESTFTRKRME